MTPDEIRLVALEFQVDTTWQAVLDGFHCGAPEEDQYCGGCTKLMYDFENAVRAHERAIHANDFHAVLAEKDRKHSVDFQNWNKSHQSMVRDLKAMREEKNAAMRLVEAKEKQLIEERQLRVHANVVRDMALRELYACQTGINILDSCDSVKILYKEWVTKWIKKHSI